MKDRDIIAFLGKDTEFEGNLTFHGTVRIDGHLKGEISTNGGNLIVGDEGVIEANIHISSIVISGEIHGNIIADQRVDIHAPGKFFGNIQAPTLVIDEGGIFEGNCRMRQTKGADEKKLGVIYSDKHGVESPKPLGTIHGTITADLTRPEGSINDIITAREEKKESEPIKNAKVTAECKGVGKRQTKTDALDYRPRDDRENAAFRLLPEEEVPEQVAVESLDQTLIHPKYELPARCFAYVGNVADTKTWKLPYRCVDGSIDAKRLPKAIQSILSKHRGTKVSGINEKDIPDVLVRLARAAANLGKMPHQVGNASRVYVQLASVLEQLGRSYEIESI